MKTKGWIIFPLTLALLACNKTEKNNSSAGTEDVIVKGYTVKTEKYTPSLVYTGTLEASREADLGASLPGKVEKIYFQEGANVPVGSLIAELSDEMLLQAQIEYNALKKDYERLQRLRDKGSVSEMDYDHVKAKYEASEAKMELMRKNTEIRAPFSGIISEIFVEEGENYSLLPSISSDMKIASGIARLIQLNPLKIEIEVAEKEISNFHKGLEATVIPDAYPGDSIVATVKFINPVFSQISHTAKVELQANNPDQKYKPGMFGRVAINLPEQEGIAIPVSAIIATEGAAEEYVFVVENNKAVRKTIQRVSVNGDKVFVKGLQEGETVITAGKNKVSDAQTVTVK